MHATKTVYIQSASDYDPNRFGSFYEPIENPHQQSFAQRADELAGERSPA